MFFSDDAIMMTKSWDSIIKRYSKKFKLLRVEEPTKHPYAIFPIFPYDWFRLIDHISLHAQNDAWQSEIAYMLGIIETIPVKVIHDRADITGNNDDEIFRSRKYNEGNPQDINDLHHKKMINLRMAETSKIAWFLEKIGQPSQQWKEFIEKKLDPRDTLRKAFIEYRKIGAIGMGKKDAIQKIK